MDVTYLLLAGLALLVLLPAALLFGPGFAGRKRGAAPRKKAAGAPDTPSPPAAAAQSAAQPEPEGGLTAGAAARARFSEGLYREALAAVYRLPRREWSEEDCALALRACLRLGDFQRARNVFRSAEEEPRLRESPLVQYLFAIACERAGDAQRATALYDKLLRLKGGYQDCEARMRRLRRLPAEDARTMSAFLETTRGRQSKARAEEAASRSLVLPGEIGGRFGALGLLGVGGSGIVFLARDKSSGRLVALKRLGHELARDPEARARFLEEAGTLAELRHPRIVEFYEALEQEGSVYLVLEYVDWDTLQTVLALRGKLTPDEVVPILAAVAEALDFAHKKQVIHRDLKPGNIVAGPKGFVKVMDFGIARHFEPGAADSQEVEVIGTPPYMAPEQHAGVTSTLSDIYSFGVTAYVLLTGRLPFAGPAALYYSQKLERDYPRLPAGLPGGLRELVDACLMFEPEKRPQGAAALLERLSCMQKPQAGRDLK